MATEKRSIQQIQREYSIGGVLRKNNSTGVCGVSTIKGGYYNGRYQARIRVKGYKPLCLGIYKTIEEAEEVLKIARRMKAISDGRLLEWYDNELDCPTKGVNPFPKY